MNAQLKSYLIKFSIVLLLIDLLCFNHIIELRGEEPRRAIVSIEMLKSGNYLIPHIYDEIYYNKPPVYNWLIAASMFLFGTGEWAARLPGALSFILIGLVIYLFSRKYLNKETALLCALAFLSSADLLFYGSVYAAEIDLFYALVVVLQALLIFWYGEREEWLKMFVFSYLLAAVGTLTKGIPSIAFQALTLVGFLLVNKRFLKLFTWQHLVGIVSFLIPVLGYLYIFSLNEDLFAFLSQQFKEASQRTGNESALVELLKAVINFPLLLIEKLFPWSLMSIFMVYRPVRKMIWENRLLRFSLVFILSNVIIYWTAPNLKVRYVYMFFPFLILLFMAPLEVVNWDKWKWARVPRYLLLIGTVALGPAVAVLPFVLKVESYLVIVLSLVLSVIGLLLAYWYIKYKNTNQVLWIVVAVLFVGRLAYNIIVMPEMSYLNERLNFRNQISEMRNYCGKDQVILTGAPQVSNPNISIAGKEIYKHKLENPPLVPFQIPYYYAHQSGGIMRYTADPTLKDKCYLTLESELQNFKGEKEIKYSFYSDLNHEKLVVWSFK